MKNIFSFRKGKGRASSEPDGAEFIVKRLEGETAIRERELSE